MARVARKDLEGKHFHVMTQGIAKENIFPDDNCKRYYLKIMQKAIDKHEIKIFAFCIMDNHAHILLSAKDVGALAVFMQAANSDYARFYNYVSERVGYVFRDRFKSEVIKDAKQLLNCLAYIHNNPVKAGITELAQNYKFSSYANYLGEKNILSVDFQEAAKYYDVSSSNIKAIMSQLSHSKWLEHNDKIYEKKEEVLKELEQKYNISSIESLENTQLLKKAAFELKQRSGLSFRKIAELLGINREKLRKVMSIPPSP
jgi:REP element-mobilizing transposase RayT